MKLDIVQHLDEVASRIGDRTSIAEAVAALDPAVGQQIAPLFHLSYPFITIR